MMLMTRRVALYGVFTTILWCSAAAVIVAQSAAAPQQTGVADRLGPAVGERVPDFKGVDQFGREHSLQSILGPQGAMIVFYRSADW
jgi:hypothetical protein